MTVVIGLRRFVRETKRRRQMNEARLDRIEQSVAASTQEAITAASRAERAAVRLAERHDQALRDAAREARRR